MTAEDSAAPTCLNYWHIQRLPEPQQPQEIVVDPAGNNPVIVTSAAAGANNSAGLITSTHSILVAWPSVFELMKTRGLSTNAHNEIQLFLTVSWDLRD